MALNPLKEQSPSLWMGQPYGDISESLFHLPTCKLQPTQSFCLSQAGGLTTRAPPPRTFWLPPPCIAHSQSHISPYIWKFTLKPTTSSKEPPLIKWGRRALQSMTDKLPINENTHTHTHAHTHTHSPQQTETLTKREHDIFPTYKMYAPLRARWSILYQYPMSHFKKWGVFNIPGGYSVKHGCAVSPPPTLLLL